MENDDWMLNTYSEFANSKNRKMYESFKSAFDLADERDGGGGGENPTNQPTTYLFGVEIAN